MNIRQLKRLGIPDGERARLAIRLIAPARQAGLWLAFALVVMTLAVVILCFVPGIAVWLPDAVIKTTR